MLLLQQSKSVCIWTRVGRCGAEGIIRVAGCFYQILCKRITLPKKKEKEEKKESFPAVIPLFIKSLPLSSGLSRSQHVDL